VLGRPGEQAEGKVHRGGVNGDGGGGQLCSRVRAREKQRCFIGHQRCKAVSPELRGL
jgi:hypothetical protein